MADFLGFLKKNYGGKHIAIVAHQAPQLALDVLIKGKTWKQAIKEDWRNKKTWRPGWDYKIVGRIQRKQSFRVHKIFDFVVPTNSTKIKDF